MSLALHIAGVDRTDKWWLPLDGGGEAHFERRAGGGAPATFVLYDLDGAGGYRPDNGQLVELYDGPTLVVSGVITDVDEGPLAEELDTGVVTTITVVDSMALPSRATFTATYPAGTVTLEDIIDDLIAGPLAAFSITKDPAQATGPTSFEELVYENARVDTILNDLQRLSGWVWRVPPDLAFIMAAPATVAVGFSLTDASTTIQAPVRKRKQRSASYGNTVVLWCGPAGTALASHEWIADGVATSWVTDLQAADPPPALVLVDDGVTPFLATVGTGGMFEWNTTTHTLSVGTYGTPAAGVRLKLGPSIAAGDPYETNGYTAQYPFPVTVNDPALVTADNGPYTVIETREDILDYARGVAEAAAILRIVKEEPWLVTIRHRAGLGWPGQTVPLSFSERDVAATYMILGIAADTDIDGELVYEFECLEGSELQPTWVDYFKNVSGSGGAGGGIVSSGISGSGGGTALSGTIGTIPKFVTATSLGDSIIAESGSFVVVAGTIRSASSSPVLEWQETDAATDQQLWRWAVQGAVLRLQTVNDAYTVATDLFTISRSGAAVFSSTMAATVFSGSGASLTSLPAGQLTGTITSSVQDNITRTGALNSGSIASGFGAIDVGADAITGGAITASTQVSTPTLTAGGNLTLSPTGDLILDPTGNDILPTTNYDLNLGALTNKFLSLHAAELWVESLVAQQTIATIGGRIIVAPTTMLARDAAPGDTTIYVKHNSLLLHVGGVEYGSKLLLQSNGKFEVMFVTSTSTPSAESDGSYGYAVLRDQDGTGANQWYAGDAVVDTGKSTTTSGFIDLYSVSGAFYGTGPTIVGNIRYGANYADVAPRWAIGNLNGLYGVGVTTFGAAFGNPSATNILIDATNGIQIRSGTTAKFAADTSGNLNLTGDLIMGSASVIRSGATAFFSGASGYWLAYNAGTPQLRIGDPAAQYLAWDGSNLDFKARNMYVNGNGLYLATPPASISNLYGYRFDSGYSGTGQNGVFASESGSTYRYLELTNAHVSGSNPTGTFVIAASNSWGAILSLNAPGTSSTVAQLAANTIDLVATGGCYIDNGPLYTAGVNSFGNYAINTNTDGVIVMDCNNGGANTMIAFYKNTVIQGSITSNGGATFYNTSSDATMKRDIAPTRYGLQELRAVAVRDYKFNADVDADGIEHMGFLGQELIETFPGAVTVRDGQYMVDYSKLVPLLIRSTQQLDAAIDALTARVATLEKQ